jgi:CBS domain-containing protein
MAGRSFFPRADLRAPTPMREDAVEGKTVGEVYEDDLRRGAVVSDSTPLPDIVETLDFQGPLEALYVLDPREIYYGLVTRSDLLGWLEQELASPQTRTGFPWDRLDDVLADAHASDAVNPDSRNVPVEPRDPLDRALRNMMTSSLTVVPVLNPDGGIEGELSLTRVLREARGASPR